MNIAKNIRKGQDRPISEKQQKWSDINKFPAIISWYFLHQKQYK